MIGFEDARAAVVATARRLEPETIALADALDRVLADDAIARDDLVPFARSAMDGFALRAEDTTGAPVELRVRAAVYAEAGEAFAHDPGTAVTIATGAPIPIGADAVVPIERVVVRGGAVLVASSVRAGDHVFPPGEDALRGDLLVASGTPLAPGMLGLLASAGFARVSVVRKPRVAIVCTGEELVGVAETPGFGQIRNSNGSLIAAAAARFGAEVVSNERVRDEEALVRAALARAFERADLVVTSGGASVGERDYVKAVLRSLGAAFAFDAVALRPARPTAFGRRGDALFAALAGNPAAAFVALHEFVRPAIATLAGNRTAAMPRIVARLDGRLHGKSRRTFLPFVRLHVDPSGFVAEPLDNQCSALTRTASDANGFAIVRDDVGDLGPGDALEVDVFAWEGVGTKVSSILL